MRARTRRHRSAARIEQQTQTNGLRWFADRAYWGIDSRGGNFQFGVDGGALQHENLPSSFLFALTRSVDGRVVSCVQSCPSVL